MNICDLIKNRKSCRAYTDQPISLEIVRSLLETAKWAPSGVNQRPSKVAVLGRNSREKLASPVFDKLFSKSCNKSKRLSFY